MLRGACLCGTVRYEIRAAPWTMYHCHCGTCRKATGTSFATNLVVAADDFVVVAGRDALKAFESSPRKHRYFCGACGSPIFGLRPGQPSYYDVSVGGRGNLWRDSVFGLCNVVGPANPDQGVRASVIPLVGIEATF